MVILIVLDLFLVVGMIFSKINILQVFYESFQTEYQLQLTLNLHKVLIVTNGALSSFKGWWVDKSWFFALHHALTHLFFFLTTTSSAGAKMTEVVETRCLVAILIYLSMCLVKDGGRYTKEEWIRYYALFCYAQCLVVLYSISYEYDRMGLMDVLGMLTILGSLYTCRKEDASNKIFRHIFSSDQYGSKEETNLFFLIPQKWLKNQVVEKTLSMIDVITVYLPIIFSLFSLSSFVKMLLSIFMVEFLIKPLSIFKNFLRPHRYSHASKNSFPSGHTVVFTVFLCNHYLSWQKAVGISLMGLYRLSTRAHTLEDVFAGMIFGAIMSKIIHF
jgi:membrane-associated phospholipid phosphatase